MIIIIIAITIYPLQSVVLHDHCFYSGDTSVALLTCCVCECTCTVSAHSRDTHVLSHVCVLMHACTHANTHAHTHAHTRTHTHTHAHTHTHTHTQTQFFSALKYKYFKCTYYKIMSIHTFIIVSSILL